MDEEALLNGLNSGKVAGAALDVYSVEPPGEELYELLKHPNLVCTPHLGASTEEAQVNVARDIANQMCDVFDQTDYVGIVNVSYMAEATRAPMKPFMALAETIGAITAQLSDSNIMKATLKTWGGRDADISTRKARELLEAQMLKGLVRCQVQGVVPDLISAPGAAKEANIESIISSDAPENVGSPYWNLLSVEVEREDGSCSHITGSVFGSVPHIVQIDEFRDLFSFKPEGNHILTFRNEDKPGAISSVLEILGNAKINIGSINVARNTLSDQSRPTALCFMSLDSNIPTKALRALKALPTLDKVSKIELN